MLYKLYLAKSTSARLFELRRLREVIRTKYLG